MIKDRIQSNLQGLLGTGARSDRHPEKAFRAGFVLAADLDQGALLIDAAIGRPQPMGVNAPTGKNTGKATHIALRIGLNGLAVHELQRTIVVQIQQPYAKELHELSRIVLIGLGTCGRVGFDVALVGQIVSHRRGLGDLLEQGAKVAKCIGLEHIQIVGNAELAPTRIDPKHRDHPNFAVSLDYFLTQCVWRADEFFPHHVVHARGVVLIA